MLYPTMFLLFLFLFTSVLNLVHAEAPPPQDLPYAQDASGTLYDFAKIFSNNDSSTYRSPSSLWLATKRDPKSAKTHLLPYSGYNATFLTPTSTEIKYARAKQEQRLAVKGAKALFERRKMAAIEYAIVQCRGCSKAAAGEENAVCFVVYNQKGHNRNMTLRQDLFTKDGSAMTRVRRDEKSECYIGDSPDVYGREELKVIGASETDHTAVFVPLLRKLTPRFWSKTLIGRKIFRMLPPAEPLSPVELDVEGTKKTEMDLVLSPGPFLDWVRYTDKVHFVHPVTLAKR